MTDPYIAEVRLFAFGSIGCPNGWAEANGQLLSISQNTALFSLLGTTFGGNGQTTFALPDLRGRAPIHMGQGNGLSNRVRGEVGGTETVTMTVANMPTHSHSVNPTSTTFTPSGTAELVDGSIDTTCIVNQGVLDGEHFHTVDSHSHDVTLSYPSLTGNFLEVVSYQPIAENGCKQTIEKKLKNCKINAVRIPEIGTTVTNTVESSAESPETSEEAITLPTTSCATAASLRSKTVALNMAPTTIPVVIPNINPSGSSQPMNNMPPYLTMTYCIALEGIYPAFN
jgi:microcystin-dependent protein